MTITNNNNDINDNENIIDIDHDNSNNNDDNIVDPDIVDHHKHDVDLAIELNAVKSSFVMNRNSVSSSTKFIYKVILVFQLYIINYGI